MPKDAKSVYQNENLVNPVQMRWTAAVLYSYPPPPPFLILNSKRFSSSCAIHIPVICHQIKYYFMIKKQIKLIRQVMVYCASNFVGILKNNKSNVATDGLKKYTEMYSFQGRRNALKLLIRTLLSPSSCLTSARRLSILQMQMQYGYGSWSWV